MPFSKFRLNPQFYSEGINTGDLNRDGIQDVISGPYWYPGPAFTQKLTFRAARVAPFDTTGDSDCYAIFTFDFNKDGWLDILSFRLPGGVEAVWYENPKGTGALWTFSPVTAKGTWGTFTHGIGAGDLNGDGRLDLIFPTGWWEQTTSATAVPWVQHSATFGGQANPSEAFGGAQIFAYDVDGDGDNDVVTSQ